MKQATDISNKAKQQIDRWHGYISSILAEMTAAKIDLLHPFIFRAAKLHAIFLIMLN